MAMASGDGGADVASGKPRSVSHDSDSSSDQTSDTECPSDDLRVRRPRKTEITRLVSVIYGQIRSLHKASLLLRRPEIHQMYIPPARWDQNVSYISPLDKDQISGKMKE